MGNNYTGGEFFNGESNKCRGIVNASHLCNLVDFDAILSLEMTYPFVCKVNCVAFVTLQVRHFRFGNREVMEEGVEQFNATQSLVIIKNGSYIF